MGEQTFGRYERLRRLASGGMATVYLGRTRGPGGFERLVAIKVMHEHFSHDPSFGSMFLDEARLAARIHHRNVVSTLDVADDGRFIVMEYVAGASLHALLDHHRPAPLALPIALRIMLDSLAGLQAAHELTSTSGQPLRLIHRDISPQNILVGSDGTSRITDFGIASARARLTSTHKGELKGKLPYMAPEQLEGHDADRSTDVYAAGAVFWELLSGEMLFAGSHEAAVACAVLAGPKQTPRQARATVPQPLSDACMRALAKPGQRFASALDFAEALEEASEQAHITIAKHREVGLLAIELAPSEVSTRQPDLPAAILAQDPPEAPHPAPFDTATGPETQPMGGAAPASLFQPPDADQKPSPPVAPEAEAQPLDDGSSDLRVESLRAPEELRSGMTNLSSIHATLAPPASNMRRATRILLSALLLLVGGALAWWLRPTPNAAPQEPNEVAVDGSLERRTEATTDVDSGPHLALSASPNASSAASTSTSEEAAPRLPATSRQASPAQPPTRPPVPVSRPPTLGQHPIDAASSGPAKPTPSPRPSGYHPSLP